MLAINVPINNLEVLVLVDSKHKGQSATPLHYFNVSFWKFSHALLVFLEDSHNYWQKYCTYLEIRS